MEQNHVLAVKLQAQLDVRRVARLAARRVSRLSVQLLVAQPLFELLVVQQRVVRLAARRVEFREQSRALALAY